MATEDKSLLPPSEDQEKLDHFQKDRIKAKQPWVVVGISAGFVGVIGWIYIGFRSNWPVGVLISLMLIGILLLFLLVRAWYTGFSKKTLIVVRISAAFVGVMALIYAWYAFHWPSWLLFLLISIGTLLGIWLLFLLIRAGYTAQWTGFGGYDKVTKEYTLDGQPPKTTQEYQPGKKLWDWLQLLGTLAIPVAVAFVSVLFSIQQAANARIQHQYDLKIANDQQQNAVLHTYLDRLSDLLLNGHLRESKEGAEVRQVARAQTLVVLRELNPVSYADLPTTLFDLRSERKRLLLSFLYDSGLIRAPNAIIALSGADLSQAFLVSANLNGADLSQAYLRSTNLQSATLRDADLHGADLEYNDLYGANMSGANLREADLKWASMDGINLANADLSGADLYGALVDNKHLAQAKSLRGTIMPDGSVHP